MAHVEMNEDNRDWLMQMKYALKKANKGNSFNNTDDVMKWIRSKIENDNKIKRWFGVGVK